MFFFLAPKEQDSYRYIGCGVRHADLKAERRCVARGDVHLANEAELKVAALGWCGFADECAGAVRGFGIEGWFVAGLLRDGKALPAITRARGGICAGVGLEVAAIFDGGESGLGRGKVQKEHWSAERQSDGGAELLHLA